MGTSRAQKKQAIKQIIDRHYAPLLEQAGFYSYNNEGFHWYKLNNSLLYKVHLPIMMPYHPIELQPGFAALPLFSWEKIPPGVFANEWSFRIGNLSGHYTWACEREMEGIAQLIGSPLPRPASAYYSPSISHYTSDGVLITHLMTESCGAELITDAILPGVQKLNTVERIYEWNKEHVFRSLKCRNEHELCALLCDEQNDESRARATLFSSTLADQCIYCHDTQLYPAVRHLLKQYLDDMTQILEGYHDGRTKYWPKTKQQLHEEEEALRHVRVLISGLENEDEETFINEREYITQRMTAQIRKKLPDLFDDTDT